MKYYALETTAGGDDTQPALIFIPDISGFTRFVNETGIQTSRNLIADLLEIIIEANILDMTLTEIQGDAVLFHRLGEPPTVQEVINQCKQIFLDFQNYLKIMERDRRSEMGASLSVSNLTLTVEKVGIEREIFDFAHNRPWTYGVLCVLLAAFTGWGASRVFRRD